MKNIEHGQDLLAPACRITASRPLPFCGYEYMIKRAIKEYLQHPVFRANSMLKTYSPKVWLIGDGRSGTTWISGLLNHNKHFREMFEPFHPTKIKQTRFLGTHHYARPDEPNEQLEKMAADIFKGSFWHSRTDVDNSLGFYDGLLIKDIFSNLFANWAYQRFDDIKIVMLIRNPFAVAASKYDKKDWHWVTDPMTLYNQDKLRQDYLKPFETLIKDISAGDNYLLKQILIWAILHYVPFRQFKSDELQFLFYENVYLNPEKEIGALSDVIGLDLTNIPQDVIKKPSKVMGSHIGTDRSPLDAWKSAFPAEYIDEGLEILRAFNLHNIYGEDSLPGDFDLETWNAEVDRLNIEIVS